MLTRPGCGGSSALMTEQEGDAALGRDLLALMHANRADFTHTFRRLSDAASRRRQSDAQRARLCSATESAIDEWLGRWRQRLEQEPTDAAARAAQHASGEPGVHPAQSSRGSDHPRRGRSAMISRRSRSCSTVLSKPYEDQPQFAHYAEPPEEHQRVRATFCGRSISSSRNSLGICAAGTRMSPYGKQPRQR